MCDDCAQAKAYVLVRRVLLWLVHACLGLCLLLHKLHTYQRVFVIARRERMACCCCRGSSSLLNTAPRVKLSMYTVELELKPLSSKRCFPRSCVPDDERAAPAHSYYGRTRQRSELPTEVCALARWPTRLPWCVVLSVTLNTTQALSFRLLTDALRPRAICISEGRSLDKGPT